MEQGQNKMISNESLTMSKGTPYPLGSTPSGKGYNFAVYAKKIEKLFLCIYEKEIQIAEILLDPSSHKTGDVWHIRIESNGTFCLDTCNYAYKTAMSNQEESPLLIDPYAKNLTSGNAWQFYPAKYSPLCKIGAPPKFDWQNDKPPGILQKDLIIYEMHVRGFTKHPSSNVEQPGTFLGVIDKIPHLLELGINTVELLPIHEFNESEYPRVNPFTNSRLCNYWGYSTINFFSPMQRYASSPDPFAANIEFKTMVRELHRHGIEVILDVVYNHTGEGNEHGQTLSFRGFDPSSAYYIMDSKGHYLNYSGCGNTFNCNHPVTRDLILESLRYWVVEMHVDGFRFDLASIFNRDKNGRPIELSPIFDGITNDPVLANTKLIAEAWDAGGLYQVGSFAPPHTIWTEWNGKYRDDVRAFIKGDHHTKNLFATRLCGSQDLYGKNLYPYTSINFITCHDGFTLADLVTYNQKHNLANGEENKDGTCDNRSWNCGFEGPTKNKKIIHLRNQQIRNYHLALMISQGIPMIHMGDEYGHTKNGNNNTWCHDNELNWFLWDELQNNSGFYRYYRLLIQFRKQHPLLKKDTFLSEKDIIWHGIKPHNPEWRADNRFLAFTLKDPHENDLYIAFNSSLHPAEVTLPEPPEECQWCFVAATYKESPEDFCENPEMHPVNEPLLELPNHSAIILKAYRISMASP